MRNPAQTKIALVVDDFDRPFGYIADRIVSELRENYNIKIFSTESSNKPIRTLKKIAEFQPEIIHFFWRGSLERSLDIVQSQLKYAKLSEAFRNARLSTSIPDYMYLDPYSVARFAPLFLMLSGYVVVNEDLHSVYKDLPTYKNPHSVIRDLFVPKEFSLKKSDTITKLIWVGNSAWGRWAGHIDHKGLETIVKPLSIELMKRYGSRVELKVIDSNVERLDHAEVLRQIQTSHVLLVASESESTPLPLLEAMQAACAVVTTDVGIAREVLPLDQKPFIVEKKLTAFLAAVVELIENKELLVRLGRENKKVFETLNAEGVGSKWERFFQHLLADDSADNYRKTYLSPSPLRAERMYSLTKKFSSAKIAKKIHSRAATDHSHTAKRSQAHFLTSHIYHELTALREVSDVVFLANPRWRGVFNSTLELSDNRVAAYPLLQQHWLPSTEELESTASQIKGLDYKTVVFSGGEQAHVNLALAIKKIAPHICLKIIWHGQSAQWIEKTERDLFFSWLELARNKTVNVFGVLMPSLELVLAKFSVKSMLLSNYYRSWSVSRISSLEAKSEKLNLGLWAASGIWIKNINVQISAIPLVEHPTELFHTLDADFLETVNRLNIQHTQLASTPISRTALYAAMQNTHLTMYVTLAECSPMTPLESIMNYSPSVVGPVSHVYHRDEILQKYLVVEQPNNPGSVADAVNNAADNLELLLSRRELFLSDMKKLGQRRVSEFLEV